MKKISTLFIFVALLTLNACSSVEPRNENTNFIEEQNKSELRSELPAKDFNGNHIFYDSYNYVPIESAELDSILAKEAMRMKGKAKQAIKIVGYTDDDGSSSYNLALAQRRIDYIAERLRKLGVKWQQIQRYPVGSEKSHCGEDEQCKKLMRRVDLIPLRY